MYINDGKRFSSHLTFGLVVVLPFVAIAMFCGFMVDDWGQLGHQSSLFEHITSWKELWAYRPISWITMPTIVHMLRDNYFLISLMHLSILTFGFTEIVKWKYLRLTLIQQRFALILLFAPAIASTVVFSVINQLSASLSIVFFAIGIRTDRKANLHTQYHLLTGLAFLCSLLCYEITLPLILTHYIFLLLSTKRFVRSLVGPAVVLSSIILWQKEIAPMIFDSKFSRLTSASPLAGGTFLYTMLVSLPTNLVSTIFSSLPIVLVIIGVYYAVLRLTAHGETIEDQSETWDKSIILLLGLLANFFLFFFSAAASMLNGYENRGMTSAWILLSLFLASRFTLKKVFCSTILLFFASSNFVFFNQKIIEASKATRTRQSVVSQLSDLRTIKADGAVSLILDVPCYDKDSKFGTVVFCTSWDAQGALLANGMKFRSVNIVNDSGFHNLKDPISHDSELFLVSFDADFRLTQFANIVANGRESAVNELRRKGKSVGGWTRMPVCKELVSNLMNMQLSFRSSDLVACMKDPFRG